MGASRDDMCLLDNLIGRVSYTCTQSPTDGFDGWELCTDNWVVQSPTFGSAKWERQSSINTNCLTTRSCVIM